MNILAVDDEFYALESLNKAIMGALPDCALTSFTSPKEALSFIMNTDKQIDVAFLDVQMPETTGISMAKTIKERFPKANIIFVTAHASYMPQAFSLHASGYILKPVTTASVKKELDNLLYAPTSENNSRLRVQCFGNFEVFIDDHPLEFSRHKSKELLAYLVNRRGAACGVNEIAGVLWEDKTNSTSLQSYLRLLVSDLTQTLKNAGVPDVIKKERGYLAVRPDKIRCDYYSFINGDTQAINSYHGEYMAQYSWAEFVIGYLEKHI